MNLGASSIATLKLGSQQVSRVMLGAGEVWGAESFDPDAADYFARITTAGSTINEPNKVAVNAFVAGCKADGIWAAIKASCLLAGPDDLTGALVPLVGAAPTNVGGGFVSGDYNRTTGLLGATGKELDINRNMVDDPKDSESMAVWLHTNSVATGYYMSAGTSGVRSQLRPGSTTGTKRVNSQSAATNTLTFTNGTGFLGIARNNSANYDWRGFGSSGNQTQASSVLTSASIFVFSSGGINYNPSRISFYHQGEFLDLALLDARLATYMAALT
jgi:hypothetical protein